MSLLKRAITGRPTRPIYSRSPSNPAAGVPILGRARALRALGKKTESEEMLRRANLVWHYGDMVAKQ